MTDPARSRGTRKESCLRRVDDDDDDDKDEDGNEDAEDDANDAEDDANDDDDDIDDVIIIQTRCDETASTLTANRLSHQPRPHNSPQTTPTEFPPISGVSTHKPFFLPTSFVCKNGTSFE